MMEEVVATVYLENLNGAVFRNVHFSNNECRALHLVMAQIVIEGNVTIDNNKAPRSHGAGIVCTLNVGTYQN